MIQETINSIKTYFSTNATKSYDFRIEQLNKLKNSILKYRKQITDALNYDLKKPEYEVYTTEIGPVWDEIDYAVENLKDWMKELSISDSESSKTVILNEPYGTVLIIVPFNYPFQLAFSPLIGAIASGNCAVIRPSKKTPYINAVINKIIKESFEPCYIKMFLPDEISSRELLSGNFDYIFFTGSTKTGIEIAKIASEKLIPYTLELGGKSPVIIDDTVNIDVAAKRIIRGKLINSGQTCIAPDYLLVHKNIKKELISQLKKTIKQFYGVITQSSPDYSRIIDEKAVERLNELIFKESPNLIYGGTTDVCGLYVEPTILDNITFNSPIMKEEIFGPVLPVIEWDEPDKLISDLKKLNKPLALYIFSKNEEFIKSVVKNLSYGGGCINDTVNHTLNLKAPFGGVGFSGIGHYHGKFSFETFSHKKTIFINKKDEILDILYPPYTSEKLEYVKKRISI